MESTTQERLEQLAQAVGGARELLILPHNDPDPDAIASALALRYLLAARLGVEGQIVYRGIVGRAENRALVRYLGHPLRLLTGADLHASLPVALVDTQPGAGNNALPPGHAAAIVLDHHPQTGSTATAVVFADVRPDLGATSTLLAQYLQAAGLEPPQPLATALFYGIQTDTLGLARNASPADVSAYFYLQSRADLKALAEIERAQVPAEYFQQLDAALRATCVYDDVALYYIGSMGYPDLAAEIADILLRLEGVRWVIGMGTFNGELILSIRTRHPRGGAGTLVQAIVGDLGTAGGHGAMASGHVPLQRDQDPAQLAQQLGQRALQLLHVPAEVTGRPLLL
jgi:nanoRNase/pAp phosphatase (c-di-AMP/oligoRNAs hydrolase)